jgi:hypothetical protein
MQIWNYNPTTGELLGSSTADPCQVEQGAWLIPARATPIDPGAPQPGRVYVFGGTVWSSVADHRGETWWKADAKDNTAPVLIDFIGNPVAQGLTKTEPPAPPAPAPAPVEPTSRQLFTALATALGKTPAEIDTMVALAKTL